jgi:hypothetical protein
MNRPLLTTILEKFRGRTLATLVNRMQRGAWERRLEKAAEEARRLAEEYKRRENRKR